MGDRIELVFMCRACGQYLRVTVTTAEIVTKIECGQCFLDMNRVARMEIRSE